MSLDSSSIVNLSSTDKLSGGDVFAVWIGGQSDNRKASMNTLVEYLMTSLDLDDKKNAFVTQYSAPNAEAFNTTINEDSSTDNSSSAWLILTPQASYTDMTITLPPVADLIDKQEVLVNPMSPAKKERLRI